jgi:hypothetical protein
MYSDMSKRSSSTPSKVGKLLGHLGLADAGGAGEQVVADRLFRIAQARAASLIAELSTSIALSWPKTTRFRSCSRLRSTSCRRFDTVLGGMRAMVAMTASISLGVMVFLRLPRHQHLHRADLVDHVDRLVRQLAVVDVARRQLDRRLDRVVGVAELVEFLEIGLQALEDLDRVLDRRLVDVDLLEPAQQGAVLLEMLAEFLVGGRADAAHRAAGQRRLQQVRGIHRAARGRARADHRVDFVDEQIACGISPAP